ncbi:sugar ABC transporter permease [Streptococcus pneumoniae]|nr:sugar ABC transporter permease [Streptococcus pneumoniae]VIQ78537.1 sugar ABC transporter permease [Streptococcus pneumoniae]VIW22621.1 sugar ABC transporter permease [Streptococcus pneumoniae]VLF68334.1 sugar ABC transporter permease [Streptococcus pneumoniae]VLM89460.1 sugar ABC transporter permease [Streptococcus pneumoniae]
MKQDERKALIGKYILLILGSVLILVPLLATLFSSFKSTKDIVDNFFGFPTNFTWDNFSRLLADGDWRLLLELCRHHCLVFTCSNDLYPYGSLLHRSQYE